MDYAQDPIGTLASFAAVGALVGTGAALSFGLRGDRLGMWIAVSSVIGGLIGFIFLTLDFVS